MTNEQLTHEVMKLAEHQAKCDAERENIVTVIEELREDVKSTKALAEDVHIMAINMQNMQKTLEETNRKVDALSSKEFIEYKESKKLIKQNIISKVSGAIIGAILTGIIWLITLYLKGG